MDEEQKKAELPAQNQVEAGVGASEQAADASAHANAPGPAAIAEARDMAPKADTAGVREKGSGQAASENAGSPSRAAAEPVVTTPSAAAQGPAHTAAAPSGSAAHVTPAAAKAGPAAHSAATTSAAAVNLAAAAAAGDSAGGMVPRPALTDLHDGRRPGADPELLSDAEAERQIRAKSRRSFLWGIGAVAATWAGFEWLGTRHFDRNIPWPFRRVLEVNEGLSRDLFSAGRLAPEFPRDAARMPRANGTYGVASEIDPEWNLRLIGLADMSNAEAPDTSAEDSSSEETGSGDAETPDTGSAPSDKKAPAPEPADKKGGAKPSAAKDSGDSSDSSGDGSAASPSTAREPAVPVLLKDIRALPRTEIVTELKCIEGWSTIVHWAGVRLVDFMRKYPPATKSGAPFDPHKLEDLPEYVSMMTPDGAYYVGLDMASALHPQTLLCYEMNGKPLEAEHGAPLRLAIPVKYGIKNIKNIGTIKFTDERPKDYWAELGYDWYAGH